MRDLDALAAQAAGHEPAGVVIYPLHAGGGTPSLRRAGGRGFHPRHLYQRGGRYVGVLQGVAFAERSCFGYLDLLGAPVDGPKILTGGGAKSRYW